MTDLERRNAYICQSCGFVMVTRDVDEGVTPFMIGCRRCKSHAYSCFYDPPVEYLNALVDGEWRKEPNDDWGSKAEQKEHSEKGGLFLYWITEPPTTTHAVAGLGQPRNIRIGKAKLKWWAG